MKREKWSKKMIVSPNPLRSSMLDHKFTLPSLNRVEPPLPLMSKGVGLVRSYIPNVKVWNVQQPPISSIFIYSSFFAKFLKLQKKNSSWLCSFSSSCLSCFWSLTNCVHLYLYVCFGVVLVMFTFHLCFHLVYGVFGCVHLCTSVVFHFHVFKLLMSKSQLVLVLTFSMKTFKVLCPVLKMKTKGFHIKQ